MYWSDVVYDYWLNARKRLVMRMFRVSVKAIKRPLFTRFAREYNVWAKDQEQAEQAVYDHYRNCGCAVGRKRISSRVYNERKPIIRQML